jgi:hypothetical protein
LAARMRRSNTFPPVRKSSQHNWPEGSNGRKIIPLVAYATGQVCGDDPCRKIHPGRIEPGRIELATYMAGR